MLNTKVLLTILALCLGCLLVYPFAMAADFRIVMSDANIIKNCKEKWVMENKIEMDNLNLDYQQQFEMDKFVSFCVHTAEESREPANQVASDTSEK